MYYNMNTYEFVRFEKSGRPGKKYDAIIKKNGSDKEIRVPFGAIGYEQYKDSTGLGLYSKSDHGDKKRRLNYERRHSEDIIKNMFSPGYFSLNYLWN